MTMTAPKPTKSSKSGKNGNGSKSTKATSRADRTYDAIIVGGGHNGLVNGAYLAKSGLKVLVLERRHLVGGAAITEELRPGFWFTTFSYALSLLRPEIIHDLELVKHGFMGCVHRCTFCFVRAFEKMADRPSDARYGTSIRVKTNIVEVLRKELARKSWKGEQVVIGTATDPYQPAEGYFRLTRGSLQALADARTPIGLITRGPMIVRDVDLLAHASERAKVGVTFSIPTLDPEVWRKTEPGTAPPRQRLRAIRTLIDAGIDASVGMAPILPGLSDDPHKMADVIRAARDAGATAVWTNVLYLRPGTREHFLENLARDWPELLPAYERLYDGRAYVTKDVLDPVKQQVRELAKQHELVAGR